MNAPSHDMITFIEGKEDVVRDVATLLEAMNIKSEISLGENCRPGG